jgi:hypothetical protein
VGCEAGCVRLGRAPSIAGLAFRRARIAEKILELKETLSAQQGHWPIGALTDDDWLTAENLLSHKLVPCDISRTRRERRYLPFPPIAWSRCTRRTLTLKLKKEDEISLFINLGAVFRDEQNFHEACGAFNRA